MSIWIGGLTFLTHVKEQRAKLLALSGKILRVACGEWGLVGRSLKIIYKGVFLPILTYAAGCWFGVLGSAAVCKVLISSQRPFLLMMTRACRTVSNEALQVLAGALPADLQVARVGLLSCNRKNLPARYNEIDLEVLQEEGPDLEKRKLERMNEIDLQLEEMWQRRWDNSNKGRITYSFMDNVNFMERNKWVKLNFKVTCFLTGHGFFRGKLFDLGLEEDSGCGCGVVQTAKHLLLECPLTLDCRRQCLDGEVPHELGWFMKDKDRLALLLELVEMVFELHEGGAV